MLRRLIAEELNRVLAGELLREAEEEGEEAESGGDEAAAEDIFGGGDEAAAEEEGGEGEEATGAAGGDAAAEDEVEPGEEKPAEEGGEDKKEEKKEEPPEPTGPTGFEFDEEINQAMAGFEKKALDVAAAKQEGRLLSMARFLFEAEKEDEVQIDVATFADDTARLISNYDTLIDMEQAIYNKAVDFMIDKYGEESADKLRDILSLRYGLEFDEQNDPEADEKEVYAAATGSSGAA